MNNSSTSRRRFLLSGAMGAAAAATGFAARAADASAAPAFDKVYDVIVVGSGFAGLAAALEASIGGAKVLLLEKMHAYGGNSAINGGAFSVAGSPLQKKYGIKDSPEQMLADMIRSGRGLSHVDLLKMVVEGSLPAYEFTLRHGVKYKDFVQHFGGHSVPRTLQTIESTGGGITRPLAESCKKHGVEMHLRAKMEEFILSPAGRVIGLKVRERYEFPNEASGVLQTYGARRGVVMATGGFSRNIWFRKQQDPQLDERLDSTNHPGATGDGLLKMLSIGGAPVQIDQIQLGPWTSPDERGFGLVSQFNTIAGFPMGIMVDVRTGRRFCNELADRKERTDAILGLMENGKPVYPVCFTDAKGVAKAQTLKNGLKYGVIKKFDKLEDLAKAYGIPVEPFVKQVDEFNAMVKQKNDTQFHRALDLAIVLDKAPFYACRVWPKVHYCMGGVGITKNAEVYKVDGSIIPGLFAAGEVTGGTHGASRLGGCAIADGLVMGRIAAQSALKLAPVSL
ncbi:flavocytochrome c [Sutterella sp.]|uniref:flavocytochrome c n=1 Tax=Sutterella sp. TaxID=1981025 RepID=UPI003FD6FD24